MTASQSNNRLEKKSVKFDGVKNFILTKEGLKGIGGNFNLKKKAGPGFVAMEQEKIDGLMKEVHKSVRSDDVIGNPTEIQVGGIEVAGEVTDYMKDVRVVVNKDGCWFEGKVGQSRTGNSVLELREDITDLQLNSHICSNLKAVQQQPLKLIQEGPNQEAEGVKGISPVMQRNAGLKASESSNKGEVMGRGNQFLGTLGEKINVMVDEGNTAVQKTKWNEVVRPKRNKERMKFNYFEPTRSDGITVISPPLSVDVKGRAAWENSLVGYFFENIVAFHVMQFHANKRWRNRGLIDVIMNEEGFFFFKFKSEEECWLIEGKPLILQRWHPKLILSKDVPKKIPMWVKIFNIPLQYRHTEGLGHICSGIGKPLGADMLTEQMCREATGRLSFAKMLVEVEANCPLPEELVLRIPSEDFLEPMEVKLRVVYPWRPSWCSTCLAFGHNVVRCPVVEGMKSKGEVRIDKEKLAEAKENEEGFQVVKRRGKEKVGGVNISGKAQGMMVGRQSSGYGRQGGGQNWQANRSRGQIGQGRVYGGRTQQIARKAVTENKFKVLEEVTEEGVEGEGEMLNRKSVNANSNSNTEVRRVERISPDMGGSIKSSI